jgi:hypothetical protein
MKKHLLVFALSIMVLTSCTTFSYQVYEVKSSDLTQKENSLVFENEDCKISYNLWGRNGSMAFIFENKGERDIFIDMSQSFFIKNDAAFDYFKDRTFETRSYGSVDFGYSVLRTYLDNNGYWPSRYYIPLKVSAKSSASVKAGYSMAITEKEKEFVCIPAKAFKVIDEYQIYPTFVQVCDKKVDFPKTSSTVKTYNQNDTPLKIRNRVAYSFKEDNKSLKFIENSFWLSSIQNYSRKAAIETNKDKECYTGYKIKREFFKIGAPNKFYVTYDVMK